MIEFVIGTVPERSESLLVTLSRFDKPQDVTVICDTHATKGSWANISKAFAAQSGRGDDWLVMLDDDTLPCRNFESESARALAVAPPGASVVSLFWGWRSSPVERARTLGASWIRTSYFVYGAAFAVRAPLCGDCLDWNAKHVRPGIQMGDARVSYWAAATGRLCYGLVPSIVQHRGDERSLVQGGRSNESFQAIWYADDVSSVEWNERSVDYGKTAEQFMSSHAAAGNIINL